MASRRLVLNFKYVLNARCALKHDSILLSRYFNSMSTFQTSSVIAKIERCAHLNVNHSRQYAKGKDKVKSSGKKVEIREDLLAEHMNVQKFKSELEEVLCRMKDQFIQNVSLRSSAGAIEELSIEFEGEKYTLRDLAQINRKNPKLLVLNFSTFPQTIPVVLQVLSESGMNLNPQQDGTLISVPIPKVTREHRESLAKNATAFFNKCKVSLRDIQTKYLKKLEAKQDDGLSKELFFILRDQVTELTNKFISQAEKMKADKINELLGDS